MRFMQGRYGFDQLGQAIGTLVIVLFIVCLLLNVFARHFLPVLFYVTSVLNMCAWLLVVFELFRVLSRNVDKRRAENDRYLQWRANHRGKGAGGKGPAATRDLNRGDYLYLKCPACGQDMRVPRGKGKVAVKCPNCGQHTITIS